LRIPPPTRHEPSSVGGTGILILAIVGSLSVMLGCGSEPPSAPPSAGRGSAAHQATAGDLERLIGRWQRPDGGYVLEIGRISGDGTVEAAYFNPSPIRISTASAETWHGTANLFVEFDDVNYRGSTYQLAYDPERDILHGTYYQAALGQTFEVVFVRLR
jgi:hypothetical protein